MHTAAIATSPTKTFRASLAVSAIRCTLTYLVFPFVLPLVGISAGLDGPAGLVLGPIAIAANGYSIHRFWSSDHRLRLPVMLVNVVFIVGLTILLIGDARSVFG